MVKRWNMTNADDMAEFSDGEYVEYVDYSTLALRLRDTELARDALSEGLKATETKLDRYEKALHRIAVSNDASEMVGIAINALPETPK